MNCQKQMQTDKVVIRDKKLAAIMGCTMIGVVILIISVIFSQVDSPELARNELIDFGTGWQIQAGVHPVTTVDLPAHIDNAVLGDTMILQKQLPLNLDSHTYLFFRASHQTVKVYIGDAAVYSFGNDEHRLFGKTPGSNWVLVPLSREQSGARVQIELKSAYARYADIFNNVYIGDKGAIIGHIVGNQLGSILVSFALIIIGVSMFGIAIIFRNSHVTDSFQRLGVLSMLIGCWSLCVTKILQLYFSNVYFLLNLEFLLFNLLPPVFLWFMLSIHFYKERKWTNILFWIAIVQFLAIEALQLMGIADYLESMIITHVLLIVGIVLSIITGILDMRRQSTSSEAKVLLTSVVLLLIFIGIDLTRFYLSYVIDEGFFTRIGTFLFISIWAIEVTLTMSKRLINMAKTETLEILAYEDLMTGLKNRTAFEEWMTAHQHSSDSSDTYIVTFDMNNLKDINDRHGHLKGDQAIISVAHIIKNTFEPMGTCFRIGGDEICVIIPDTNAFGNQVLEALLQNIEAAIASISQELDVALSVASGYSKSAKDTNSSVYEAYKTADDRMYAHKQKMKGCL